MTRNDQNILITAALPYANGYIHLGHLAGAYLPSDMYARFQRLRGRNVLFLCGSDEHGVAITVSAEKEGRTPQQVVDRYHPANEEAFAAFGMSFDHYARTSRPLHHATAQTFFRSLHRNGVLKEKEEKQLYCEKDRMFLADRYVEGVCPVCGFAEARGDQCEKCGSWLNQTELKDPKCRLCGTTPVIRQTKHWYFPLGAFQDRLRAYIRERDERDGWRENVKRYCESWFKEGLQDRAVTRDLRWGVPVPVEGYESKVMYVWFDAVLGYISAGMEWAAKVGSPEAWRSFWQDQGTKYVAFIGKDNVVFHCIVFPAMLMAWNDHEPVKYVLPENVPANEFLNLEGEKFSKSRGWGIDVKDFLRFFRADYLRYALSANLPETKDADFSLTDFQARINNELADTVGNFVNRTLTFTEKHYAGKVPAAGVMDERDLAFDRLLRGAPDAIAKLYESYHFRDAVQETMGIARLANKYFNDGEPWKSVKTRPEACATTIHMSLRAISTLGILLSPVIPSIASDMLGLLQGEENAKKLRWIDAGSLTLTAGHEVQASRVLVPKVEKEHLDAMKKELMETTEQAMPEGLITIDDFKKVRMTVGTIDVAESVPKSSKLLRVVVDLGKEHRQVVAGIAQSYDPVALKGKQVIIVSNLKPAMLMGLESNGMLLAAHDESGTLRLVTVDAPIASGASLR